ncbi:MAG: DUF4433 domain-containing protein [Deltaproteobacteria bacterium]|nr:MAG: DUF4433 domain-containing protein [Deltaproteobacteria bacterium]
MSEPPARPKIYHITHVDNLPSILAAGGIDSDAKRISQGTGNTNIGMTEIKQRRLTLDVDCYSGTKVGEYVPFYFCPRSIMLYLIYMGNHPDLAYTGGQRLILHLETDLYSVVQWAEANNRRWAFSKSNAGAFYARFRKSLDNLHEVNWDAVAARDFRDSIIKEGKQAEFLLFDNCPWKLIERIGVIDEQIERQVIAIIRQNRYKPIVSVQPDWYY